MWPCIYVYIILKYYIMDRGKWLDFGIRIQFEASKGQSEWNCLIYYCFSIQKCAVIRAIAMAKDSLCAFVYFVHGILNYGTPAAFRNWPKFFPPNPKNLLC